MSDQTQQGKAPTVLVVVAWLWVGLPFLYGLWQLVIKIPALFGG
ncbi:MFS transporter small subunit [Pseudonocardia xishanensis]|uniref:Oxalate:formate antiporter n=1 Tax=Pseudonocardia xishanensis TaxID=630995 RepID=A0ABP8RZ32_9PSEU